jgi:hypothetical protein
VSRIRVVPIVEGHGEYGAIRTLLDRAWRELLGGEFIDVLRPIRWPRTKLIKQNELVRAVELAALKLQVPSGPSTGNLIMILLDAEADPPCLKGPELLGYARDARPDIDIVCVLANIEYETWFVAAADSLCEYLIIPPTEKTPEDPESSRCGKGWIKRHFIGNYSESLDQPRMTARMDLSACRTRSPSFDKLCRELERRKDVAQG